MNDTQNANPYAVNYWGSHPSAGNDDCFTGEEFATYDEAYDAFHTKVTDRFVSHVEIKGDDGSAFGNVYIVRENPEFDAKAVARERAQDDRHDAQEAAMQVGMAFGCDGYNDAMGW